MSELFTPDASTITGAKGNIVPSVNLLEEIKYNSIVAPNDSEAEFIAWCNERIIFGQSIFDNNYIKLKQIRDRIVEA